MKKGTVRVRGRLHLAWVDDQGVTWRSNRSALSYARPTKYVSLCRAGEAVVATFIERDSSLDPLFVTKRHPLSAAGVRLLIQDDEVDWHLEDNFRS